MKRYHVLLLLMIFAMPFYTTKARCQNQTERIAIYVKVWGFLKYHHPNVAGGTINWDSVFIAHLDKAIVAKTGMQLNAQISALLTAAGPINNPQEAHLTGAIFTLNHDLDWLQHSTLISAANREKLQFIFAHRNRGNNRFVKFNNITDYSGENPYDKMTWPDAQYRMLFLARFWNAINYYDPYKFIAAQKWNTVLTRFIPKVGHVKDTTAWHKLLLQMAVSLHDGHSQLDGRDNIWGRYISPFYIAIWHDTVIITHTGIDSICRRAGIQKGSILLAINGEPIAKRIAHFKPYITSSSPVSLNRHLEIELLSTPDTVETVTFKQGGKIFTRRIKTMLKTQRNWQYINNYTANDKGYEMIEKSIIRVYTMQLWEKNVDTIKALMRGKKAVIFDARSYTSNDAFYNIFDMFLPAPEAINYNTKILPDDPGYFQWKLSPKIGGINRNPYNGTVIILADERCQSQGEYSVMALQTIPHSITIGSQTSGTDGVVSLVPMGGGLGITHSGYGIYYPDKTPTQQCGLRIDIEAKKTAKSIIKEEDVAMEKAMEYLKGKGVE